MYLPQLLKTLEKIEFGSLDLTTPDKKNYRFDGQHSGVAAHLELRDASIIPAIFSEGSVAMARTYKEKLWDTDDLVGLMEFVLQNEEHTGLGMSTSWIKRILMRMHYMLQRNSIKGSLKNIAAHYDLGNDFYALWLDDSMTYSSGIFKSPDESLEQAQRNKYDRILGCLNYLDGASQHILEIGCGWGGFAERLLSRTNHQIKGITLSLEQYKYARQRLKKYGNRAGIFLQDYRRQHDQYDAIVSIEMFEAVGEAYWPVYFRKIANILQKNGKAVIQTITIDDACFDLYRKSTDMIRSYIFPGGMLPSPSRFQSEAVKAGLKIVHQCTFGASYAQTLQCWLDRFHASEHLVRNTHRDDAFIRLWRFYLCFCMVGFRSGRTDVMQAELIHA